MPETATAAGIFEDIDRMDAKAFASWLSDDCTLRFANADEIQGRDAIEPAIEGFFGSIAGLTHRIVEHWEIGDAVIFQVEVTYTRKDGGVVTLPAAVIQRRRDGLIREYRIYIDQTPLYA